MIIKTISGKVLIMNVNDAYLLRSLFAWQTYLLGLLMACATAGCNSRPAADGSVDLVDAIDPVDAAQGILDAFDTHPLVALGEAHGLKEQQDFVAALIRNPAFVTKVNAIVLEAGNAKYQNVINRYVAGDSVSPEELQQVWREHTCTALEPMEPTLNESLFAVVRAVNHALPPERRLRVLAGDPPIDWSQVRTFKDFVPWLGQRDRHYAKVVETEILARGNKALLIAGTAHFHRRRLDTGVPNLPLNVVQDIEKKHPGTVFVVTPHLGFGNRTAELEPRLKSWPRPSLVLLQNTWLGALDTGSVDSKNEVIFFKNGKNGPQQPAATQSEIYADRADAYLYLGPYGTLTMTQVPAEIYCDEAYVNELDRRHRLATGRPLDREKLLKPRPKQWAENLPEKLQMTFSK